MDKLTLEPSPAGYRHMRKMFLETKASAEKRLVLATTLMEQGFTVKHAPFKVGEYPNGRWRAARSEDVLELFNEALELLVLAEQQRIQQMDEGLAMLPPEGP